jgi:hypothetical protein
MTIDAEASPCRPRAASVLIHQLDQEAALGCDWWETETAGLILGLLATGPAATVFLAIAQLLCEGGDPDVIVGGPSARAALAVALEWLDAGVEPDDVATWLRAGCWKPAAARAMADGGVQPDRLLKDDDQPLHWVDIPTAGSERVPLARAVAEEFVTVEAAVAMLRKAP